MPARIAEHEAGKLVQRTPITSQISSIIPVTYALDIICTADAIPGSIMTQHMEIGTITCYTIILYE